MAIDVSVQHNGLFLTGIVLLTQYYYHPGTHVNAMTEEVFHLQPMIPPKRFDIFPLTGGCSEGPDAFSFFFFNMVFYKRAVQTVSYYCSV